MCKTWTQTPNVCFLTFLTCSLVCLSHSSRFFVIETAGCFSWWAGSTNAYLARAWVYANAAQFFPSSLRLPQIKVGLYLVETTPVVNLVRAHLLEMKRTTTLRVFVVCVFAGSPCMRWIFRLFCETIGFLGGFIDGMRWGSVSTDTRFNCGIHFVIFLIIRLCIFMERLLIWLQFFFEETTRKANERCVFLCLHLWWIFVWFFRVPWDCLKIFLFFFEREQPKFKYFSNVHSFKIFLCPHKPGVETGDILMTCETQINISSVIPLRWWTLGLIRLRDSRQQFDFEFVDHRFWIKGILLRCHPTIHSWTFVSQRFKGTAVN